MCFVIRPSHAQHLSPQQALIVGQTFRKLQVDAIVLAAHLTAADQNQDHLRSCGDCVTLIISVKLSVADFCDGGAHLWVCHSTQAHNVQSINDKLHQNLILTHASILMLHLIEPFYFYFYF